MADYLKFCQRSASAEEGLTWCCVGGVGGSFLQVALRFFCAGDLYSCSGSDARTPPHVGWPQRGGRGQTPAPSATVGTHSWTLCRSVVAIQCVLSSGDFGAYVDRPRFTPAYLVMILLSVGVSRVRRGAFSRICTASYAYLWN